MQSMQLLVIITLKIVLGSGSNVDNGIWFVGAGTNFGDFGLNAMYLKGDLSGVNKKY